MVSFPAFRVRPALVLVSVILLLTACGGGGGDSSFDIGGGGGGGGGSTPGTETFAYIANNNGAISIMAVDTTQATLLYRGFELISGSGLNGIAMHPSQKFLYALATGTPGSVHGYAIDASTGGLTAINDLPTDDNNPGEILVNPSGTALYVTNRTSDKVSQYIVNSTIGVLGTLGAALSTGQNPVDIKLHPNGQLLFTVNRDDQSVWVFPVNSDGSLQTGHSVYTDTGGGSGVTSIAFDDDGTHAYLTVINSGSNGFVRTLSVDTTTGALNPVDSVGAGNAPEDVKVDATGTHAYVSNYNSNTVIVYNINQSTGTLTSAQTTSGSNGMDGPDKIGMDPDGEYLYVNNVESNQVSVYAISAGDGQLTLMDHYRTRSGARGTVLKTGTGTVTHVAKYLFAPDTTSMVQTFPLDATTGALGTATGTTAGTRPMNVAVHPSGKYVYVINQDSNDIYSYSINPDTGALSGNGTNSIGGFADMALIRLAIDPNGKFLYALDGRRNNLDQQGRVFLFEIGSDGKLTYSTQNPTTGYLVDYSPENFLIDPSGKYLYVICSRGDQIDWFQINPTTGSLVGKQSFSGWTNGSPGGRPLSMAIHPNGRWAYVTAEEDDELWKYYLADSNGDRGGGR